MCVCKCFWLPCCCDSSHFQTHHSDEAEPRPPPMYPRGNFSAAIDEYMGVDYQLAGGEGDKTHCTVPVRPRPLSPIGSWLSCLLFCLCLWARWPSVTGATHVNGPDAQCKNFSQRWTTTHRSSRTALRLLLPAISIRLFLTNQHMRFRTWPHLKLKKALLCYLSSFFLSFFYIDYWLSNKVSLFSILI